MSGADSTERARVLVVTCLLIATIVRVDAAASGPEVNSPELLLPPEEDPTGYFRENSLHDKYSSRMNFDQYVTYGMRSLALVAGFDNDLHRYDSGRDLINSFERNLTYGHDLSALRAHIDSSETDLLREASELTLIENERNQATCARHLDLIFEEALKLFRDYRSFTQSKQLDLIDFLDSYGSAPSEQLMMGNTIWLGGYEQCQSARVELQQPEPATGGRTRTQTQIIRGRYCVAHLRLPTWSRARSPEKISLGSESVKLGVCLPRACNSISILRHSSRLEALIRLVRLHQVPYSRLMLTQLFCLPDESSPLRQLSPSARLFLGFVLTWLTLVAYFSLKYEIQLARGKLGRRRRQHQRPKANFQQQQLSKLTQVFALRHAWHKLFDIDVGTAAADEPEVVVKTSNLHENLRILTTKTAPVIQLKIHSNGSDSGQDSPHQPSSGSSSSGSDDELRHEKQPPPQPRQRLDLLRQQQQRPVDASRRAIESPGGQNLTAIDGIKVISMVWLISGHTMLFFIRNITNGRQFWAILLDGRFLTIMAGIFPVDSFFTVTGVLTSYLKFNKSRACRDSLRTLNYWLEIFVHRYLRFMPMYLLIFWYTRDVSEYLGSGPMWDYATASTSLRSICKRESVWVPMLFQANFKPIEQHCVKPAWYLANDYQYLLITPIYMLLLLLSSWLGYLVIGLSIAGSLAMQFLTVYKPALLTAGTLQEDAGPTAFSDFETLANFRPMFATYVLKDLWRLYVLPYNRIPPYLIGLLTGHLMYRYNQQRTGGEGSSPTSNNNKSINSTESLVSASSSMSSISSQATSGSDEQPKSPVELSNNNDDDDDDDDDNNNNNNNNIFITIKQYLNFNVWTPVVLLLSIIYLPIATKLIEPQEGERAKIVASCLIAMMRFVWSLSVARLIYLCYVTTTTAGREGSFIISLLSSPKWKPFSKIGLSVLLIQWEIIGYVNQVQAGPPLMSISYLLAFVIICILLSYALGLLVYLVFEFPMSQIEHLYIHPRLFGKKTAR